MGGRSSQRKGRAAELELSRILQGHGYNVESGRALSYGEVPDLSGLPGVHIECKRTETLRMSEWMQQARRWAVGGSGAGLEDLEQAGAIAMLRATDSFDGTRGTMFSTHLFPYLKQEFTLATGRQTKREQMDPLQSAVSLDAPLTDDEGDPLTLADMLPDPAAEVAIEEVAEHDQAERLRAVLEAAIAMLEPEQQAAVRRRYYEGAPPFPPGPERQRDNAAHAAALRLLRHPSRSRTLLAYWYTRQKPEIPTVGYWYGCKKMQKSAHKKTVQKG